ncbi:MAG: hypothetical protein AAGA77_08380 [Bacteroidota bacterium]
MKRKIVLWGTNEKEEKILVALHLLDKEGKVNLYTFNENIATEEFYNQMLNQWREGIEIEFPEGYTILERPLSISDSILPVEIKVDRPDIISRAQTEWHVVVLSSKMYQMYKSELEDLSETIENLREYDNKIWNEMRNFWSKVQEHVIEKNLSRDHAQSLKNKTNRLFDRLKELKKKVEEEYEANSAKHKDIFMSGLKEIEEKIEKGLGLKPIFEELKSLQYKLRDIKFTKNDRNTVWERLDAAFKVVKEKRFGDKGENSSHLGRHQRRYDGLINAIAKMERSIKRDKDDQKFQDRKIATTNGQLEMQIRQAKVKMIEERIKSKEIKLQDMYKTKKELEAKIEKEKQKEEKRAKMDEAKAAAEAKIAEEMKKSAEANEAEAEKLEEAAAKIKQAKEKNSGKPSTESNVEESKVIASDSGNETHTEIGQTSAESDEKPETVSQDNTNDEVEESGEKPSTESTVEVSEDVASDSDKEISSEDGQTSTEGGDKPEAEQMTENAVVEVAEESAEKPSTESTVDVSEDVASGSDNEISSENGQTSNEGDEKPEAEQKTENAVVEVAEEKIEDAVNKLKSEEEE